MLQYRSVSKTFCVKILSCENKNDQHSWKKTFEISLGSVENTFQEQKATSFGSKIRTVSWKIFNR